MKRKWLSLIILLLFLTIGVSSASAASYRFQMVKEVVNLYISEDGNSSIEYDIDFQNDTDASPIDFVDIGLPNSNFDLSSVSGEVNGEPISDIQTSEYVTYGYALGLGGNSIQPGATGHIHTMVRQVSGMLYTSSEKENEAYASFNFTPNYFGSEYVHGNTDLTMTIYLPVGVKPEEPRYYKPENWPGTAEPTQMGFDEQGRAFYRWQAANADGSSVYKFGGSFPARLVPATAISTPPSASEEVGNLFAGALGALASNGPCLCGILFFGGIFLLDGIGKKQRRMQYLPPKIALEGHGIKRGLTAVEASILMEQPIDKVMTMILFSLVKKNAAQVTKKDPLAIEAITPAPEGLKEYETDFLEAFKLSDSRERNKKLQDLVVKLIRSVTELMKGFSRKETVDYYKGVIDRAWQYVSDAETPEVKMQKYDEAMDWTMLDHDFGRRTKETFSTGPVYMPMWWGRYDPGYHTSTVSGSGAGSLIGSGSGSSSQSNMPSLPGADFAASMVNSVSTFSAGVIGNVTDFTNKITNVTNPAPVSRGSSGHSGGGCACACACAGCACACAGGGR